MTPCEDVQTIHASKNDNEAREWGFELHNNGEKIDSSSISDQLVFKAYKGGTEQILPENGSVPTTSPIIADIKYPQGLLTDQEFLYRESPTEEDGLSKITDIKGNTLVWNQQLNDTGSTTTTNGITFTKNADGSITLNGTATAQADYSFARFDYINGHKYLINGIPSGATVDGYRAFLFSVNETSNNIYTATIDDWFTPRIRVSTGVTVSNVVFRLNIFDLTKMGLDSITSVEEFTSLFPLQYSYDSGSLLPFRGEGIKTVGKNLFDINDFVKGALTISDGILSGTAGQFNVALNPINNNGIPVTFWNNDVTISFDVWTDGNTSTSGSGLILVLGMSDGTTENAIVNVNSQTTKTRKSYSYIASQRAKRIKSIGFSYASQGNNVWHIENFQIEFSATETSYEPYTSSTLSLPISTYFSTGMKSAGSVYDELMETKAITRIGVLDLDSVNWSLTSSRATTGALSGVAKTVGITKVPNMLSPKYEAVKAQATLQAGQYAFFNGGSNTWILSFYYDGANKPTGLLYYELATPTETSFTTASLVTENAEIPLSNEDGVLIGKCTEQLSSESGFFDAKIKLADEDGECYSNKIQLHIERKPS